MAIPPTVTVDEAFTTADSTTLPSPATFDILPPLHQLLSRLLAQSSALPIPPSEGQESTPAISAPVQSDPNALVYKDLQPLDIQHLAQEASRIKIRIQKARQAVKALPDIERTVEDQEEEIKELEEQCAEFRNVLSGMATRAKSGHAAS